MFRRKKKLAELERRVEELEKELNVILNNIEMVYSKEDGKTYFSVRFKEPEILPEAYPLGCVPR